MSDDKSKLPVWITVAESYRFVFTNLGALAKVAALPVLIAVLILTALFLFADTLGEGPGFLITTVVLILILIPFLTKWHRITLIGLDTEVARIALKVGRREGKFLLYGIIIIVLAMLLLVVPLLVFWQIGASAAGAIAFLPFIAALFYLTSRFSLVFPGSALGRDTGLGLSWSQTTGNGWRLLGVFFVAEIPWRAAEIILDALIGGSESPAALIFLSAVYIAEVFISVAILASCLSFSYLHIVGKLRAEYPQD